jgi:hypothetical protein
MLRSLTLCCFYLLATHFAMAQSLLYNGGFEDEFGATLEGWEWTCEEPVLVSNPAPDGGSWSAVVRVENTSTCTMAHMFQRLPDTVEGDVLTLAGWVRNNNGAPITGAFLGLGTLANGVIVPIVEQGTLEYPWTYLSISWTVTLDANDTAVVILSPGALSGSGIFSEAGFDELSLTDAVGINEMERPTLIMYQQGDHLYAATTNGLPILEARLLDAHGRCVRSVPTGRSTIELAMHDLGSGVYVLVTRGASGSASKAFVRE